MEILSFFPDNLSKLILEHSKNDIFFLEEIRIRVNQKVILKFTKEERILDYIVSQEEILKILQFICDNSIYSYQNQICKGYITIKGGHRVGISGEVVLEDNKVKNISYVYSLNFRIAREINGAAKNILEHVINISNNSVYNTLIVGLPGTGKTTIIRDLTRQISNGIENIGFKGVNVGIVDERGEISAMHKGIAENDVGLRTDILNNVKKNIGIEMLVRSMSPQVIIADEIGNKEDSKALNYAFCSGVKGIFTAHGDSFKSIKQNKLFNEMIEQKMLEKIIILDNLHKGIVSKVFIV